MLSSKSYLKNKLSARIDKKKLYTFTDKILEKVENANFKEKEFLKLFLEKYPFNKFFQAIPRVAIREFSMAMFFLDKLKRLQHLVIREIFLELYKKDFLKAIECYCKLNDFHTKVELSRETIDYYIPKFKESFFVQTMSILDSQNIVNTPMYLATIAPREVLKYYGEIEDDIENRVDEVIEKIEELKSKREEARSLKDRELLRSIGVEIQKLKDEIQEDNELFEAFLTRFEIDEFEFEDRSLWDLV